MDLYSLRQLCLSLPGTSEKMPFASLPGGYDVLCFYVGSKMFCMTNIDQFEFVNLKGHPDDNVELCERHASISPGRHMNKRHWISVNVNGDVDDGLFARLVKDSYAIVLAGLPRRERDIILPLGKE